MWKWSRADGACGRAVVVALLLIGVGGCGRSSGAAAAPSVSPGAAAGTWHTRLAYRVRSTGPAGLLVDTQAFVTIDQPAICHLDHGIGECKAGGDPKSEGHVYAVGQAGDGVKVQETYQKSATWRSPPAAADITVGSSLPGPSHVGSGLSTAIELHGYVQGVAREVVNSADGTFAQAYVNTAQPYHTRMGDASGKDPFELKLSFDPSPGQASAPASGDLPQRIRDALNKPNGELDLAAIGGNLIGAETVYGPNGRLWLCYTRKLVGQSASVQGFMTLEVSYCGWLTQAADTWEPDGLPPTDRATR